MKNLPRISHLAPRNPEICKRARAAAKKILFNKVNEILRFTQNDNKSSFL